MKAIFKEITEFTLAAIDNEVYNSTSAYDKIHVAYELDSNCIVHPALDMIHALSK